LISSKGRGFLRDRFRTDEIEIGWYNSVIIFCPLKLEFIESLMDRFVTDLRLRERGVFDCAGDVYVLIDVMLAFFLDFDYPFFVLIITFC
jgi:hypothetical protein